MTCQECQPLAIDLARSLPPFDVGGAVQRADVLSHVATCKRCAQWLSEQEALSDALRAAAAADASLAAPPGVEANVMAAFRARQTQRQLSLVNSQSYADAESLAPFATATATVTADADGDGDGDGDGDADRATRRVAAFTPDRHVARQPSSPARTWRSAWPTGRAAGFAAAAAIVIVAFTLESVRWLNSRPASNGGTTNVANAPTPLTLPSPSPSPPAAGRSAGRTSGRAGESAGTRVTSPGTNAAVIEVLPDKGRKTTKGQPAPPRASPPRAATARGLAAHTARSVNVARGASEFSGPAFVLLPYAEPLRPTEMRHIMRVRMTRAQFAAAELQADVDDSTVLADVLVGEDGTARAVRIVQ